MPNRKQVPFFLQTYKVQIDQMKNGVDERVNQNDDANLFMNVYKVIHGQIGRPALDTKPGEMFTKDQDQD